MDETMTTKMGRPTAIRKFFSEGEGYPEVTNSELLAFKKEDPEGFDEIGDVCVEYYERRKS